MDVDVEEIERAVRKAAKRRRGRKDVRKILADIRQYCLHVQSALRDGSYKTLMSYREMRHTNNNGKVRDILCPDFFTLTLQHLCLQLVGSCYVRHDPMNGLNCKQGCGITAKDGRRSVVKRLKHLYYDRRDLNYALVIDQRECYAHVKKKVFRKELKKIVEDKELVNFATDVCFAGEELPIGTPTSPLAHHVVMLAFDKWVASFCRFSVRYADDNFLAFATKEEAQAAKWRVKNYWWYELGMRAKRHTARIISLDSPCDFCGYVFRRNAGRGVAEHDKGVTLLRRSIYRSAVTCGEGAWPSYFGLLCHADAYKLIKSIELRIMNAAELTSKVGKIDRKLDAANMDMKDLAATGQAFTIYDYDLRCDARGVPNWVKCLIGIPELDAKIGRETGRIVAKEYHGSAAAIVEFHAKCDFMLGKKGCLPMTDMVIENRCGYVYKGTTNVIEFINEDNFNFIENDKHESEQNLSPFIEGGGHQR